MNTSQHDDDKTDDNTTADDPTNDSSPKAPQSTASGQLWWQGALAGAAAGGVALMFGQLVEALSETIPGLVLGMGEWVLDITPGWAAEESIENLGSSGKASLLPGITIVALLAAAALGNASLRISRKIGIAGFAVFGLLGGFTTARNPSSPALQSWFWALVAAGLGIATLLFLLNRLRGPEEDQQSAGPLADPLNPPASRRAFLGWSAGAGAVAVGGFALSRGITPKSAAETAREKHHIQRHHNHHNNYSPDYDPPCRCRSNRDNRGDHRHRRDLFLYHPQRFVLPNRHSSLASSSRPRRLVA